LKPIEDPEVAQRLLQKVNDFNAKGVVSAFAQSLIFASLPQDIMQPLAAVVAVGAFLYFSEGKVKPLEM